MNSGNYSSPSEARAKRRGGRGFYADRNRPYQDKPKSLYRDRHRSPEQREAAEAGRELARLAEKFPRFRDTFNRTRNHVLMQSRGETWKRQMILRSLGAEPMAIEELAEDTALDRQSVRQVLASLEAKGDAAKCDRNGDPVLIRRDNKPAGKVYWRRAGNV